MTSLENSSGLFISQSLRIHFNPSQNISIISLLDNLVMVTNEGSIRSNLAYFVHVWNISNIVCHKESLKFSLLFISKFRFDWVHEEMLNDTYLMIIKINYSRDTKQQS